MEPIVKYECPVCHHEYKSPEEAKNCYKPIQQRFKTGDILQAMYGRHAYRVTYTPQENDFGISAEHVLEYDIANGNTPKKGIDARGYYIGGYLCSAKKYDIKDAQKMVKDLKKRLDAAEKFLEMVKDCQ